MPDQPKTQERAKLTGKDNYGTWSTSTEVALMTHKAWKVINGKEPPTPESFENDSKSLDAACKEWLLETLEKDEVTTQKITANRKKFKKHLADVHEQWEELNDIAVGEIYNSCIQSVQVLIGKKKNAAEIWKQLESSFSVSGFASDEHTWAECPKNPKSDNYIADDDEKRNKQKDNEAKTTTLSLEGIPSDLLTQLEARWAQHGSVMAVTAAANI